MPLYLLWSTLFKIIVCDCCCYTLHSHREFIQTHFATTSTCFIKPLRCHGQPHIQRGKKCQPLQRKKVKKFIVLSSNEFNFLHRMCHRGRGVTREARKWMKLVYSLFLFEGRKLGEAFLIEWATGAESGIRIWCDETPMFSFLLKARSNIHKLQWINESWVYWDENIPNVITWPFHGLECNHATRNNNNNIASRAWLLLITHKTWKR